MPSKEKVVIGITKNSYSKSEVQHLINSITHLESQQAEIEQLKTGWAEREKEFKKQRAPKELRKGDVIVITTSNKNRPAVVIKVLKELVVCIPLSTTQDSYNLAPSKSRFFREGYFSNHIITIRKELALEYFAGVYDNSRLLNNAIKEMRLFLNKVL